MAEEGDAQVDLWLFAPTVSAPSFNQFVFITHLYVTPERDVGKTNINLFCGSRH